ncbi:MAG: hypothetical protein FJ104_06390 [Deltaproteobacteria bacterium]|nr:hypothetical protein [Deltaproteobacteria bacterium]
MSRAAAALLVLTLASGCGGTTAVSGSDAGVGGSGTGGGGSGGGPFAQCELPPPSTCSREATCEAIDCGGLEFTEEGCKRPPCERERDCAEGERCVALGCAFVGACEPDGSRCSCGGPAICMYGSACNLEARVGPGGEWLRVELLQGAGPCPPGEPCTWRWSVTPDGVREYDENGVAGTDRLDDLAMQELDRLIDGPELRPGLVSGFDCAPPPTDIGVTLRLELPGRTLERDVTGCVVSGPEGNIPARVAGFLRRR